MQLEEFVLPDGVMDFTVDFSNAMNPAPYTAQTTMGMPAIYELFRNLGKAKLNQFFQVFPHFYFV